MLKFACVFGNFTTVLAASDPFCSATELVPKYLETQVVVAFNLGPTCTASSTYLPSILLGAFDINGGKYDRFGLYRYDRYDIVGIVAVTAVRSAFNG